VSFRRSRTFSGIALAATVVATLAACERFAVEPAQSVVVVPSILTVGTNAANPVSAQGFGASGVGISGRLTYWESKDTSIVRVEVFGTVAQVRGVRPGTTTISATIDGNRADATVTVRGCDVPSIAPSFGFDLSRFVVTNSGLCWRQDSTGTGTPTANGRPVTLRDDAWSADGTVIATNELRNFNAGGSQPFSGLSEGIAVMYSGSIRTLIVPPLLGGGWPEWRVYRVRLISVP
jgi:hypothetical protein